MTHVHSFFFFFNDTATTEIYTLSLHDALPLPGGNLSAAGGLRRRIPLRRQAAKGERGRGEGLPDGQDRQAYAHPARYPRCFAAHRHGLERLPSSHRGGRQGESAPLLQDRGWHARGLLLRPSPPQVP